MRKLMGVVVMLAVLVASVLPTFAQEPGSIIDVATADGRFTTLLTAVEAAGLTETLSGEGAFTVFAPTDDAFAALPEGTLEAVLADPELLTSILLYHVVDGEVYAEDVLALESATTLNGADISISVDMSGNVILNETVMVIVTDIEASNGVIHVIDGVLLPPAEESAYVRVAHFSSDTPAVDIYVNGEVAIAALEYPTVTDWVELPAGTYSVAVAPAGTSEADAAIGPADLEFAAGSWTTVAAVGSLTNGTLAPAIIDESAAAELAMENAYVTIFHAIEDAPAVAVQLADGTVLVESLAFGEYASLDVLAGAYDLQVVVAEDPSVVVFDLTGTEVAAYNTYLVSAVGTLSEEDEVDAEIVVTATDLAAMMAEMPANIIEAATAAGNFTTLLAAVEAAGLTETLMGEGPFTVFAPSDEVFAALPEGTLEAVLADPEMLTGILTFHVVPGTYLAADIAGMTTLTTANGAELSITIAEDGTVLLNGDTPVLVTDIVTGNGVIHVIGGVLVP